MPKTLAEKKKLLNELTNKLKELQTKQAKLKEATSLDQSINVKIIKKQGRFKKIRQKGKPDKNMGHFLIELDITAKTKDILIPISIASGKRTAGFMYYIEGTAEGSIVTAKVTVRGDAVTQIKLGTLTFAKIPAYSTASFRILIEINGKVGKTYKIVISRLNYKFALTEARYQQYLKPIISSSVKFTS